jgi:ubiquinone/menaquinone biosynthesis C-methylase UbiE
MQPVISAATTRWERAYQAFESPAEERRKFIRRLKRIGAHDWDRNLRILEVCSGRGSGLGAWRALGFRRVFGVDLSPALVFGATEATGRLMVGDVRALPVPDTTVDVVIVQGGLHHLVSTRDVNDALGEMRRVLAPQGRIVVIEPWLTPFLRLVHAICSIGLVRRLVPRLDALATMIEEERVTYERWLNAPDEHLAVFTRHVAPEILSRRWGKIVLVGTAAEGLS